MTDTNKRKLEDIADDILDSFPIFFRRISKEGSHPPGSKKFDPSRFVLRAIWKHGTLRMSDLGRHLGISKPYMTLLVDKLIDEGLVERVSYADDRRVVNVTITEAGRDAINEFSESVRETVMKNLSSLDSQDISSLHESMKRIRAITTKLGPNEKEKCKLDRV